MRSMNVLAVVPVTMSKRRGSCRRACRRSWGQHTALMGTVRRNGLDGYRRGSRRCRVYPADQHAADQHAAGERGAAAPVAAP
jgi:hypothetical protein